MWMMIKHLTGDVLTVELCVSIDLAQLMMYFDWRYGFAFKNFIIDRTSQSTGAGIRASIYNHRNDAILRTWEVPLVHASLLYHVHAVASCK